MLHHAARYIQQRPCLCTVGPAASAVLDGTASLLPATGRVLAWVQLGEGRFVCMISSGNQRGRVRTPPDGAISHESSPLPSSVSLVRVVGGYTPRDRPRESAAVPAHTPEPRGGDGVVPAVVPPWCLPWCLPWCSGSVGFIVAAAQENQSCTGFVSLVATGLLSPNAEGSKSLRRVCSGSDKEVVPPFHIIMNDSRLDVSGCF